MNWPEVINIKSDSTQIRFVEQMPKKKNDKELFAKYVFTKSVMSYGKHLVLSESQVKKIVLRNE